MIAGDVLLPFDHGIIPQETGYWCGPASCQVACAVRGVYMPERQAAREMGTHTGGTDHIGLVRDFLNRHLGDYYDVITLPANPTPAQRTKFFEDAKYSIDAGFAMPCNICPPEYPRPARGERLNYGGSGAYHYSTVVGYNDALKQLAWGDSGFPDYFCWVNYSQLCTCVGGKGYTAALRAPAGAGALPAGEVNNFIYHYFAPIGQDVKDIREQLCGVGSRNAGQYSGWPQMDNLTVVDAIADMVGA